jgi:hypothetical protein
MLNASSSHFDPEPPSAIQFYCVARFPYPPSAVPQSRGFRPKRNLRPTARRTLFFLRQRLHDLARAFDEELRQWTEGAVFQGHDPNWPWRNGQCHGQDLERREI